jgi:tetratricopeptide (TPR) repeat protein
MRLWVVRFACVLVLGSSSASFGQEPSGPRTLENLLKSDDAEQSAAPAKADVADAVPKRPSGTVIRAKDGVQHPDLDKAWADYDAAVAKASKGIQAAIAKQFDAATSKGNLDAAVTWQEIGEKFEKAGEIPTANEINGVVSAAVNDYEKALEQLSKAYESTMKVLTKEKRITEAKAVRAESLSIQATASGGTANAGAEAVKQRASTGKVELSDPKPRPRSPHATKHSSRQQILAMFIGRWRHENGKLEELKADGSYVVSGDVSNPWSGKWVLELDDPRGPCAVRHSNNQTVARWYVDPDNPGILRSLDGEKTHQTMRRQ